MKKVYEKPSISVITDETPVLTMMDCGACC